MEGTSTVQDNNQMFDSGYSNTCSNSNSQSQRSVSSSLSRESNRSESSGYFEGHASTSGASNKPLPVPTSSDHKKKEKTKHAVDSEMTPNIVTASSELTKGLFNVIASNPALENKSEELAVVELVDATDPREHNDELTSKLDAGLGSRTNPLDDSNGQTNDNFYVIISMADGLVVYTTISLETPLGYSKSDWIGKSFVDFIRPEDKTIFLDRVNDIALSQNDSVDRINEQQKTSLICGMKHRSNEKISKYNAQYRLEVSNLLLPFHLSLTFEKFRYQDQSSAGTFLVVYAQLICSAYKEANETIMSSMFTTRHAASCQFFCIDVEATKYLGYLPQDMIGKSVFDFYHPEDLPCIKDVYETVMKLDSTTFKSKPYRFIVQNGGCVTLETEWSRFVNPWTQKLEFVVGQHRVLKGPAHPDVFRRRTQNGASCLANVSEAIIQRARELQREILLILNKNIQKSDQSTNDVFSWSKDFAPYMERLLQEMSVTMPIRDHLAVDDRSFSGSRNPLFQEHDSVMLGEISPHHEYFDSKSSTETPLSYNQLNYNENIERFFKSKPDTVAYTNFSMDDQTDNPSLRSSNDKISNGADTSTGNASGASGSGEFGSNSSKNLTLKDENMVNVQSPILSEVLINKHNENMEKLMIQKHKELRSNIKNEKHKESRGKLLQKNALAATTQQGHLPHNNSNNNNVDNNSNVNVNKNNDGRDYGKCFGGLKRNRSCSFDSKSLQKRKQKMGRKKRKIVNNTERQPTNHALVVPSNGEISSLQLPRYAVMPPFIPIYYVPIQPSQTNGETNVGMPKNPTLMKQQELPFPAPYISYVPSIIYPSMLENTVPVTMMYKPVRESSTAQNTQNTDKAYDNTKSCKRNVSKANFAAKPDGGAASCQDNEQEMFQVSGFISSCIQLYRNDNSKSARTSDNQAKDHRMDVSDKSESSTSSFYSSFLNSSCSCNTDQKPQQSTIASVHTKPEIVRKDPHWLEGVNMTPKLIYEYQMDAKSMDEVLKSDMKILRNSKQPVLVNSQLDQLYHDLELEGFNTKLILDANTSVGDLQAGWAEEEL